MRTRVLWLIVAAIAIFIVSQVTATQLDPAPVNLALGKPVVASSVESITLPAHHVNDGDPNTRWSSQFEDNQWIVIDLEASYDIHQVVLNWETAYGESYDIDVSVDGFNWETVFEERNGDGVIDVINFGTPVLARFVRMIGLVRGTAFGFSLWEFEIFERDPAHRYVDGNGVNGANDCLDSDNPCATIAHAISQANPGNTIQIAPGAYTESLTIDKSLTLQGAGQGSTTIQAHVQPGMATNRVITLPDGLEILIADVTIRHGQASGDGASGQGGGIRNEGSILALTGVNLNKNEANVGGGMYNTSSSPTLTNVAFIGNEAIGGGGLANINDSSPELANVTFSGNTAGRFGGGMYNQHNSSPTLVNVTFNGNESGENGGGMDNGFDSSPTLVNVTFNGNMAGNLGGGLINFSNSSPTLTNTIIWGNTAEKTVVKFTTSIIIARPNSATASTKMKRGILYRAADLMWTSTPLPAIPCSSTSLTAICACKVTARPLMPAIPLPNFPFSQLTAGATLLIWMAICVFKMGESTWAHSSMAAACTRSICLW